MNKYQEKTHFEYVGQLPKGKAYQLHFVYIFIIYNGNALLVNR